MDGATALGDLIDHLTRCTRLPRAEAGRVLDEVLAYFAETPSEFVARRHSELRREGEPNARIYERISSELRTRRFTAPTLTQRQIRRLIYG